MSYAIYTTQAFVLKMVPHSETNSSVCLFTRELGKIWVRIQGARKTESKLRPYMQLFSMVTVELVRGKHTWRLIGAYDTEHIFKLTPSSERLSLLARIAQLLDRFIQGDDTDSAVLFDELHQARTFLLEHDNDISWYAYEPIMIARLLHCLGYIDTTSYHNHSLEHAYNTLLQPTDEVRKHLIQQIQQAFFHAQL